MLESGARVGRYELVRFLGEGGAGVVWAAVLHGPGGFRKAVALKVLKSGSVEAVAREARLGAVAAHVNLVVTHDVGEADGHWYVAMELVDGPSLATVLQQGPLDPARVIDVGIQVCAGLAHLHGLDVASALPGIVASATWSDEVPLAARVSVVHRDIKPANLLLAPSGIVKVADLGLARLGGSPAPRGGTLGYIAPEQLAGTEDARADVYSLGVTLAELATGRPPDGGEPAWHEVDRRVPGLADVLRGCVALDRELRWASARELSAALATLGAPAVSRPVGPTPSSAPARRAPGPRLVGRHGEAGEIASLLEAGERTITLVGPGGIGKTTLVRDVAARESGLFVDASAASTADELCVAVAQALALPLGDADPVEAIGASLALRPPVLLVLDNLEQVADAAADAIRAWLDVAPIRVLSTSRRPLRNRGERVVAIGPLSADEAGALFADRLSRTLDDAERAELDPLIEALEGVPLAIELAAARARALPLGDVRRRLSDRLRLLAGGGRDLPERHRSLRASLDASGELLGPTARRALGQLSVFEGGFTLEAAEAVLSLGATWAVDAVQELVDASLVQVDLEAGRFSLLLATAAWAAEGLEPVERDATLVRHGAFYAQLGAREARGEVARGRGPEAHRALAAELPNLVAACRRAFARRDGALAPAALAAWMVYARRGPYAAGRALLEEAAALPQLPDAVRAELEIELGDACRQLGDLTRATEHYAAALVLAGADRATQVRVRVRVAAVRMLAGDRDGAVAIFEAVLPEARALGERDVELRALGGLGSVALEEGRLEAAATWYRDAVALARTLGDRDGEGLNLSNLALVVHWTEEAAMRRDAARILAEQGNLRDEAVNQLNLGSNRAYLARWDEAEAALERTLELARRLGDRRLVALAGIGLARTTLGRGRPDEALARFDEARAGLDARRDARWLGMADFFATAAHEAAGRPDEAVRRCERAIATQATAGNRWHEAHAVRRLGDVHRDRGAPAESKAAYERALGAFVQLGARADEASVLSRLGLLALGIGSFDEARAQYAAARDVHAERGASADAGVALGRLALVCVRSGDATLAQAHLAEADGLVTTDLERVRLLLVRSELAHRTGDAETARRRADEARDLLATVEDPDVAPHELAALQVLLDGSAG